MTRTSSSTVAFVGIVSLAAGWTSVTAAPTVVSDRVVLQTSPVPQGASAQADVSGLGAELAYGTLQAKIEGWGRLPADWDGRDGQALGEGVIKNAISMLALLRADGVPCPTTYVAGDGETGLRWQTTRGFASVSFLADMHIVALVEAPDLAALRIDEPFSDLVAVGDLIGRIKKVA